MQKERLDLLLFQKGYFSSREKAKANIEQKLIYLDGKLSSKPGEKVDINSLIEIKGIFCPYVSRGGLKLEKAIKVFEIHLDNKIAIDIGASTGGFTDCMLKNNVKKVYCIDVGTDQLDESLKNDVRVVSMEKTNIRNVNKEDFSEAIDVITIDVSFISLKLVLPIAKDLINDNGLIVTLIKPQFECGKVNLKKNGVVKDKKVHALVLKDILEFAKSIDLKIEGLDFSPLKGPEGNIEFLACFSKNTQCIEKNILQIVENTLKLVYNNTI